MSLLPTDSQGRIIRYNPDSGQYEPVDMGGLGGTPSTNPIAPTQPPSQMATHDFDPNTGLSREAWRDQFMGLGNISPQAADEWLRAHGGQQLAGKGDVWNTPYGDTLDLQIGRGVANANGGTIRPGWTTVNSMGGGQSNGSIMQAAGNPGLMAILQMLSGSNQQQQQPTGQMPYNPYAGMKQQTSNYFGNASQPVQTNGTLLGTSYGPSATAVGNNMQQGMNQSRPAVMRKPSGVMGTPTNYQQRNEQFNSKPIPNNNLPSNF